MVSREVPEVDGGSWLARNWWKPAGVGVGFLIALVQSGYFDSSAGYRPPQSTFPALVAGVGLCWALNKWVVLPARQRRSKQVAGLGFAELPAGPVTPLPPSSAPPLTANMAASLSDPGEGLVEFEMSMQAKDLAQANALGITVRQLQAVQFVAAYDELAGARTAGDNAAQRKWAMFIAILGLRAELPRVAEAGAMLTTGLESADFEMAERGFAELTRGVTILRPNLQPSTPG